jgi:hypothetical protein
MDDAAKNGERYIHTREALLRPVAQRAGELAQFEREL